MADRRLSERRYRVRRLGTPNVTNSTHNWPYTSDVTGTEAYKSFETEEEIWDYSHRRSDDGMYREGSPMSLRSTIVSREPTQVMEVHRPGSWASTLFRSGRFTASTRYQSGGRWLSNIEGYSPGLWNRARPTNPNMSLLNAIAELRDLPRMLKQRFTPDLKGASSYWLALQFGWKPLLNDVRKLYETQKSAKDRLEQLIRDEGRPIRRRVKLPIATRNNLYQGTSYNAFDQILVTQAYAKVPEYRQVETMSEEVRFSGRFRYFLPSGPRDWQWRARMLARIYGLNPTPSVVYNAIPWTWLVDWFSNLGDMIANLDGGVADRLAADYAFTTSIWKAITTLESTGYFYGSNNLSDVRRVSARTIAVQKWQNRVHASPFGPLIETDTSLTAMQWSILGALGFSGMGSWRSYH